VPASIGDVNGFTPTYTVAQDGSGTHRTLQAAIDAVPAAANSSARVYIRIKPGTYRELICALDKAPITLYGLSSDASQVLILAGNYNGKPKTPDVAVANPCSPNLSASTYGTSGSATVAIYSNAFQAKNLSFGNDAMSAVANGAGYPSGASDSGGAQAVALLTRADKLVFENVRVLGHQDTLYVTSPDTKTVSRVYFKGSHIQGDTDFIFGRAALVLDACTIHYVSSRLPVGQAKAMFAPSTSAQSNYGMRVNASTLTAESGATANTTYLGRAWDESVAKGSYEAGTSPNGQLLIRNSSVGAHVRTANPWTTSTSGRAYSDSGNRFDEYRNTVITP
jgi:pectinesterase